MRFDRTIAVLVLATGVTMSGVVIAEDPKPAAPPPEPEQTITPITAMTVVPYKPVAPRPEHAVLAALAGHWVASVHTAVGPYVRARDAQGTADGKALMGGLFVQVTHSQTRQKQPFEGMMLYGYNEAIGKYTADWIDSSSTAVIHYVGTYDAEKKQLQMTAHYSDEKSRRLTISRTVTVFVDDKTWVYEEYRSSGVGEPETPIVAITFKRG